MLALNGHGLTDTEIAGRFSVSPKTVEHHVGRVLAKLGLRSRTKTAAFAARQTAPSRSGRRSGSSPMLRAPKMRRSFRTAREEQNMVSIANIEMANVWYGEEADEWIADANEDACAQRRLSRKFR